MAHGGPVTSPYLALDAQDVAGNHLTMTFTFNEVDRSLISATIHRDPDCLWHRVLIGLGPDGTPDNSSHMFNVQGLSGNRDFNSAQLRATGFVTIEDVLALQITAGP